jgi:hypothetical protein
VKFAKQIVYKMKIEAEILKGRVAQINPPNPYQRYVYDENPVINLESAENFRTEFIEVFPKTMINKVTSPDIPLDFSLNPYQGCEHGCVYCYARNTHPYGDTVLGQTSSKRFL